MIYTVLWRPQAEQQLARLWTDTVNRAAVTKAADKVDEMLRRDPQSLGESRSHGTRLVFVLPLAVLYEVREPDRMVYVKAVALAKRRH